MKATKELTFGTSKKVFKYFENREISFDRAYRELRKLRYSPIMARKHLQDLAQKVGIEYSYRPLEDLEKMLAKETI